MKKCYKCGLSKDEKAFNKNKTKLDGLSTECKECIKLYSKEYRTKNINKIYDHRNKPETRKRIREYDINYRKKFIEEFRHRSREHYYRHKEKILERMKERHSNSPQYQIFSCARMRAKKKNLEFNITLEDIIVPEYCPVLNIPLFSGKGKQCYNSPTLDRIDNNKGYTKDNIMVISWRANNLKRDASMEELQKIVDFYKKLENQND